MADQVRPAPLVLADVPAPWRALVLAVNPTLHRLPDGLAGIRDVDAPCEDFEPVGAPFEYAKGNGMCDTDGHYICRECVHISEAAVEARNAH